MGTDGDIAMTTQRLRTTSKRTSRRRIDVDCVVGCGASLLFGEKPLSDAIAGVVVVLAVALGSGTNRAEPAKTRNGSKQT